MTPSLSAVSDEQVMSITTQEPEQSGRYNAATRVIASTLGVLVGIGSIEHGLLECLQGFRPTHGLIVNALGPGYRWTVWTQGGEGACTLIPNFLVTGVVSSLLGALIIVWSLCHLQSRRGPIVFLLIGVASFLSGGGVAQVPLIVLTWGVATRIRASLAFWRWLIPAGIEPVLGKCWPWTLFSSTVAFLIALDIAVFGYFPGLSEQVELQHICWSFLAIGLTLYVVSICFGFAYDVRTYAEDRR